MTIYFYHTTGEHGCFSNFSHHTVKIDGLMWETSEHYYQAQKFLDQELQEKVFLASGPGRAADIGRDRSNPRRDDWEDVKDDVMRTVVRAKFSQNEEIKKILINTGDEYLVEDSPTDYYWGCGAERTGKNMLGRILMEVREELKGE